MSKTMFEKLALEIVHFCQTHNTKESYDFVLYELYLRTVSKNYLGAIARQREPPEGVNYYLEDEELGK